MPQFQALVWCPGVCGRGEEEGMHALWSLALLFVKATTEAVSLWS